MALTAVLSLGLLAGSISPMLIPTPASAGGIIYRYSDAGGIVVYTNQWESIPPSDRRHVERLDGETLEVLAPPKALVEIPQRTLSPSSSADVEKPFAPEESRNEPVRWIGLEGQTDESDMGSSLSLTPLGLVLASAIAATALLYLLRPRKGRMRW